MISGCWHWNREERAMEMRAFQKRLEELWERLKAKESRGRVDWVFIQEASQQVDCLLQTLFPTSAQPER